MHCVPTAFGIFLGAAALKFGAPDLQDQVSLEKFLEARWPGAKLDDGWPESEKNVFQAALRMVVVKDSR